MLRYFSMALVSFAGLGLAAPQASQAQVPVGVQVRVGPGVVTYQPGYSYVAPPYVVPAPVVATPVVVRPRVVIGGPVYSPWYWNGYRWYRHERWEHRGHR